MWIGLEGGDEAVEAQCDDPCGDPPQAAVFTPALPDQPGPADLKERRQGEQENGPGDRHGGKVSSPLVMMALRRSSRRQNIRQRAPSGAGTTTTPEPWQQPRPRRCPGRIWPNGVR